MRVPLSWLADYVELTLAPEELARRLTFAGLEVEAMDYVGLPLPAAERRPAKVSGLEWERDKVVVGAVVEVRAHPDADRLVLAEVDDGRGVATVVTGAPDLLPYLGRGRLAAPLKVAYAREGAAIYDGTQPGWEVVRLKRAKIRGIESASMVCSEKELGISDEHEGIILFDADAPEPGTPLADYAGDVVLELAITPNMARNASILGVAREVAALTGAALRPPSLEVEAAGAEVAEKIRVDIREPGLNPRFTATLLEGVTIAPSPFWLQRRLRLAGMRPINNVVDVTNYVMLELGQPLHAFDYDVLAARARRSGAEVPTLITRLPEAGERLTTLDGADRALDESTILVADTAGVLSLGGIMGGEESEVSAATTRVLLEAAGWDFINIRRTVQAQRLAASEAGYRFSRGVHPALAARGNRRAIELMRRLGGGTVCRGMVDAYPAPPPAVVVDLPLAEVGRSLGVDIPPREVVEVLTALEFAVEERGESLRVTTPDHRLDVAEGVTGVADLVEEIARVWGYERIPETQITDTTPPQRGNPALEAEERVRDLLAGAGLQEVMTYRLTTPEREARARAPSAPPGSGAADHRPADLGPYVRLANPITEERAVMRRRLLPALLEVAASNARFQERLALFEIGPVYLPEAGEELPAEPRRLALLLSGPRAPASWTGTDTGAMDFFDLKGVVEALAADLYLPAVGFEPAAHPSLHPGRTARLAVGGREIGVFGELHPEVRRAFDLPDRPLLGAELDFEALVAAVPDLHPTRPVPRFPAVVEDLAVVVDAGVPAGEVRAAIEAAGGELLREVRLFDLYRGEQVGSGKKSLAYRLTYQAADRTLTDPEAARLRARILKRLERDLGAVLR